MVNGCLPIGKHVSLLENSLDHVFTGGKADWRAPGQAREGNGNCSRSIAGEQCAERPEIEVELRSGEPKSLQ